MLQVNQLSKSYGELPLLDEIQFLINPGERVGLVGRNGHGKTTLFKMILGQEHAESGEIVVPKNYRIGSLDQHLKFSQPTVLQEALLGLGSDEEAEQLKYKAESTLMGLGLGLDRFEQEPSTLSSGYQIRLQLAKVLISEPNLLLLDEPTNYLDIVSLRWLERFLRKWPNELLLVTHDRGFMDNVCTHTLAIHRRKVRKQLGSTEKLYEQIALEEEVHEKTRVNQEKSRKSEERFIERFRAKASKAAAVQSRIKMLEKRGTLDQLGEIRDLSFSFNYKNFQAKRLLAVENLSFGYDDQADLFSDLEFEVYKGDRIAVIGPNGRGKTTLLRVLANDLAARQGTVREHPSTEIAFYSQEQLTTLHGEHSVEQELLTAHEQHDRKSALSIAGLMMFTHGDAEKQIKVLSGGEKSRVLMGKLLVSPSNLLLLDEPTNHLDMQSVDALRDALERFEGASMIVTHSERLLHELATRLIVFDGGRLRVFEGTYKEFLQQIGWCDEDGVQEKVKAPVKRINKKELRKLRAEVLSIKSKKLGPIGKEISKLEEKIMKAEEEGEAIDKELVDASMSGDSILITALSKQSKESKKAIQKMFDKLESLSQKQAEVEADFEKRLAELEK